MGKRGQAAGLTAGVAEVDISPPAGVQIVGYPTVIRRNTGVHDPLCADCLVLDDGHSRIAVVTADLVYFEKDFVRRFRRRVEDDTGIPAANLMMCCSHTHAGPRVATRLFDEEVAMGGRVESEYLATLMTRLLDLVKRAVAGLRPARIGFGAGKAGAEKGIGGNRHDPAGPADPAVRVIGVQGETGEWIAVLVKYSLHPTILQMDNFQVSADYPWGIRNLMKERHPEAIFFFAQGATGDQSSRYFRKGQTFEEAGRFGRIIGEEADRVLGALRWAQEPVLGAKSVEVEPVWKEIPPIPELEERIARYWEELHELETRAAPYVQRQTCYLDRLGTELTLAMARCHAKGERAPWEYEAPLEVQAFRIGDAFGDADACIVALAGESFVEYTLAMEKGSPFTNTYVVTVANGMSPGYVVDREAAEKRLFEFGASMMMPETGQRILRAAAQLTVALRTG
jgi:neutral ceramidase